MRAGRSRRRWQVIPILLLRKSYRLLAPDETVVTPIKTGSSGAFSLYVPFSRAPPGAIVVLLFQGNYSYIISLAYRH
ncbi:MAG: hypothetical protein KAX05_13170 [Bacteroidales bacterium]|nr:hypothetical protein [Bacteroidales bacterium]